METDSFFYHLLKTLPRTLFDLLGLPASLARSYRFDSVEVKKAYRIDGLFLPKDANLPLYVVEVQHQYRLNFYANIFSKVFGYLHENDPRQEWVAVAIFASRTMEPKQMTVYEDLLGSKRVKRFYLDEQVMPSNPPLGLGILRLVSAPETEAKSLVSALLQKTKDELSGVELGQKVIELVEELLVRRFVQLNREEIRTMFQLHDLRETRVWQEGHEEGYAEGMALAQRKFVQKCLEQGMAQKRIAELLGLSLREVRRLVKDCRG